MDALDLPRGAHVFIDETKARDYIMVGVWVASTTVSSVRRTIRVLQPTGARRLHFKKLTDGQRRRDLAVLGDLPVSATAVRARSRAEALSVLLAIVARHQPARVVIEADESYVAADMTLVRHVLGAEIQVQHLRSAEEPILWASDAIAWCLQRGGHWSNAVSDTIMWGDSPGE